MNAIEVLVLDDKKVYVSLEYSFFFFFFFYFILFFSYKKTSLKLFTTINKLFTLQFTTVQFKKMLGDAAGLIFLLTTRTSIK